MAIQPGFSLENRTCTWKRGHGRHWYVRKKTFVSGYMGLRERMYFIIFFIIQTVFHCIFHYFLFFIHSHVSFLLDATSGLHKPITIFFCIIKRSWIFDMFLKFLYVLDVNKNNFYCNIWSYLIVKRF